MCLVELLIHSTCWVKRNGKEERKEKLHSMAPSIKLPMTLTPSSHTEDDNYRLKHAAFKQNTGRRETAVAQ